MDHAPVDQESRAAELSPQRQQVMQAGDLGFYDKVPTKFAHLDEEAMKAIGVRVVPPAVARRGSLHGQGRDPDALLRQHRRLCR